MSTIFTFEAIGTKWNINISDDIGDKKDKLFSEIKSRIGFFDKNYSRFRADSLVTKMSQKAGDYKLPEDALGMLTLYKELYSLTGGLVTPLIGQVLSDTGYDAEYSLKPKIEVKKAKSWEESIEYKHPILTIKKPSLLDFGAFGKGYLIDFVSKIIEDFGAKNYVVEAGGDMVYKNESGKTLRVGLENPEDFKQVVGVAEIKNQSICGSAGNRRVWGKYHHIINPKTVESPKHILGLWVVADSTLLADAMSTALFFVEPKVLQDKYKFECAIVYSDHKAFVTKGFPGQLFEV